MKRAKKIVPKDMKVLYLTEDSIYEYVELMAEQRHINIQEWRYKINDGLVSITGTHKIGENEFKFHWLKLPLYKYYIFGRVDMDCSWVEPKTFNETYDEVGDDETEYLPLNDDLNQMLMSAVRYALGRRTYIVSATCDYVSALIPKLSDQAICVMERDIREQDNWTRQLGDGTVIDGYGDEVDRKDWMVLLLKLQVEMTKRNLKPW